MHARGDSQAADVFDFVAEFLTDRERGREKPLAHYLARYSRCQEAIAREYLALLHPGADEPHPNVPGAAAPAGARDGEVRIGPYRILAEIGRGGQGAVFLAEDTRIARRVALKVLASRFDLVSEDRRLRFRREAEVIARLEHPGICGIYDADVDGDTPYIAMRHIEGRSLAQILHAARHPDAAVDASSSRAEGEESDLSTTWPPSSSVDVRRVLLLFERVARALHAAHEAGVVHRDLKPGNVMIQSDGKPVLLDFGLARDEQSEAPALTMSGEVFGTPAYMSPEQIAGGGSPLDRRTDVYSLGVSLYEALTLERPFEAPSRIELHRKIQNEAPPDPRDKNPRLTEDVKVVLETALERDRERRYSTALDFAEDLRRIREYEPIQARPAGALLRLSRWTRRHPVLAVVIPGTIVALASGLALTLGLLEKADSALEYALGRHLAERCEALIPEDPALALAIGVEAADREILQGGAERGAHYLTRSALFDALEACWLERVLTCAPPADGSAPPKRFVFVEKEGQKGRNLPVQAHVSDAAASPDGRRVVIATDEGVAQVFDLATGNALFHLLGHSGAIVRVCYTPDGGAIATACADGALRVFDAGSGSLRWGADVGEPLTAADVSADGSQILTLDRKGRARIHRMANGERALELDEGPGAVAWAAFDPRDTTRWVSRAAPEHAHASAVVLRDAIDGRALLELDVGPSPVVACAFDPSHDRLAVAAKDGDVHLFAVPSGAIAAPAVPLGAPPTVLAFSPDGNWLFAATDRGEEGDAFLLDLVAGRVERLAGHEGRKIAGGAFSPDGSRLATAGFDRTVAVWDVTSGRALRTMAGGIRPIAILWTPDGSRLVTPNLLQQSAHVWFARNRPDVFDLVGHTGPVVRARFSPDRRAALTASSDGTARLWSLPPPERTGPDSGLEPGALLHVLRHEGPLTDATYSSDGERVLTASVDGTARVWSTRTGEPIGAPLVHPAAVRSAVFDARGDRVLTICADGRARLFATATDTAPTPATDRTALTIECASGAILCAVFDPSGETLACGCESDRVEIRDAETARPLREIVFQRDSALGGVTFLAFDPSGAELAGICGDERIRFWDPNTGERTRIVAGFAAGDLRYRSDGAEMLVTGRSGSAAARVIPRDRERAGVYALVPHTASVTGGALAASGDLVLTFSRDGTAHVWESARGRPIAYRANQGAAILDGAFDGATDATRVIVAREDGSVSIWPVDPLPAARARRPREFPSGRKGLEQQLALPLRYE